MFFGRKRSRRGHQKRGTDDLWFGERIDCSREPWKRRTECVVRFPTLFPFISLSKSHFSLCAKMRSDLLPSLGLARLPHGVFLQFGRSARFRQLKRIYIYTYTTSSALWRETRHTHTAKVLESLGETAGLTPYRMMMGPEEERERGAREERMIVSLDVAEQICRP